MLRQITHSALSRTALFAACAVAACGAVPPGIPHTVATDRVVAGDAFGRGVYSGGRGLTVRAGLRNIDGRVAVCGAWQSSSRLDAFLTRQVLGTGFVTAGGERLAWNLNYLNEVRRGTPLSGATANCADTGLPWTAAAATQEVEVRLPAQVVERDCEPFDGCDITRFRPISAAPEAE